MSVGGLSGIINLYGAGVIELTGGDTFLEEAAGRGFILGEVGVEGLDRDLPLELGLFGLVDGAHAACAEPLVNLVFIA